MNKKKIIILVSLIFCITTGLLAEKNAENKITEKEQTENTVKPTYLTKEEFLTKIANYEQNPSEWKYLGDKPCIIDFYASWCGPCKRIAPILEELAKEYAGQIYIYKIDTEKEKELAMDFGIRSIPTLLFCPMDENPQIAQGALPKETFIQAINEVLLKKK